MEKTEKIFCTLEYDAKDNPTCKVLVNDKIVHEFIAEDYTVNKLGDYSIIVDDICSPYISGSLVDLLDEGIKGKTLIVQSPRAVSSCGCGESIQFADL